MTGGRLIEVKLNERRKDGSRRWSLAEIFAGQAFELESIKAKQKSNGVNRWIAAFGSAAKVNA